MIRIPRAYGDGQPDKCIILAPPGRIWVCSRVVVGKINAAMLSCLDAIGEVADFRRDMSDIIIQPHGLIGCPIMRWISILLLSVFIGLSQFFVLDTVAQTPAPAAPGAGQGFLIDKHVAAHVACAQCHTQDTATPPTMATCLTCHGGTYEKLAAMTAKDQPNPHDSHQGQVPCASCHHVHMASQNFCSSCHNFEMKTP